MRSRSLPLPLLFLALSLPLVETRAELEPLLLKAGQAALTEDFSDETKLGPTWAIAKGDWKVVEGALVGKELAADNHGAVNTLRQPFTDAAIRFRFKIEGARMFALSFNHKSGHLMRVVLGPKEVRIVKDKNKKDPSSKPQTMATAKSDTNTADGQWHTALCEMKGETITIRIDDSIALEASHADFTKAKTGFRFVVAKESVTLDDLTVWLPKK